MAPGSRNHILRRTVAATVWPVTLAEAKADLRVEHDEEDAKIQALIQAASELAGAPNGITGKSLTTETWALSIRRADADGRVNLPVTPAQSLESISYYDAGNQAQSLDVASFYLHGDEDWAYIQPKDGATWPAAYDRLDAVTVTFKSGFGDAVPDNIRQGIRLMVAHWYENRLAASDRPIYTIPLGAELLLGLSRKGWVS